MTEELDLTGQRFGKLLVVGKSKTGRKRWDCRCDCGRTNAVTAGNLRAGHTRSCGCLRDSWVSDNRKAFYVDSGVITKAPTLSPDILYQCDGGGMKEPFFGIVVAEYANTACVEVLRTNSDEDQQAVKEKSGKIIIKKKDMHPYPIVEG